MAFVVDEGRLSEATRLAWRWHGRQTRKGKSISYVSHLLHVQALVIDFGGSPDESIAALLHDSLEDAPSPNDRSEREELIESRFGEAVLRIVLDCTDTAADDVRAGAIYDRGAFIYQHGKAGGALMDARGQSMAAYLREQHPGLKPKRILDMGCTVSNSTLVYCDAYPGADVYGVEPGAPIMRYAHARAEYLGKKVHYSQQNAEHTDFEDGYFDVVVSAVMLHETSGTALRNIFKEAHRLLKPGGLMAHLEVPVRYKDLNLCDQVMRDWQTYYNDEPFWGQACSADLVALALESGFFSADEGYQPQPKERGSRTSGFTKTPNQNPGWWYIVSALK